MLRALLASFRTLVIDIQLSWTSEAMMPRKSFGPAPAKAAAGGRVNETVELIGIEPTTSGLQSQRSPS
jgi:hypothetical protein